MDTEPDQNLPISPESSPESLTDERPATAGPAGETEVVSSATWEPAARTPSLWRGPNWLDLVLFIVLAALAIPGFYRSAGGDLFSDEADYGLASTRGFEANRRDLSDSPKEPNRLAARRHYHAPLTVDVIALAHRFGADDRVIRLPFILAGGLFVGLTYLCGSALFDRRREIAIACALLTAIAPPIVRMASHALPWSLIILELLLILWTLAEIARGGGWGWIVGCCAALAALFVTSEVFFVAAPAAAVVAPFLFWPILRRRSARREIGWGLALGGAVFLVIALVVWPNGLAGGAVKMLRHYMQMRHSESFPVNVGSQIFTVAPKWSYLYWYWNDYRPFFVCYALGVPGLLVLAVARKLQLSLLPLLSITGMLLFAAHRAHIIGPEYLAHCLPFLSLLGGYAVYAISLVWRPLAPTVLLLIAIPVVRWSPRVPLPGMDARAQVSRWPGAARFLAGEWKTGDKIAIGSQPVSVGHWYLVYQGGVSPAETQFQALPVHEPRPIFLDRLQSGVYRYVAVSNMFQDGVDLDAKTLRILREWPIVWRSDEHGTGPSRLVIYRSPGPAAGNAGAAGGPISRR